MSRCTAESGLSCSGILRLTSGLVKRRNSSLSSARRGTTTLRCLVPASTLSIESSARPPESSRSSFWELLWQTVQRLTRIGLMSRSKVGAGGSSLRTLAGPPSIDPNKAVKSRNSRRLSTRPGVNLGGRCSVRAEWECGSPGGSPSLNRETCSRPSCCGENWGLDQRASRRITPSGTCSYRSVIEQEFLGIEQPPEKVLGTGRPVRGFSEEGLGRG
jgi:hypothetical protein